MFLENIKRMAFGHPFLCLYFFLCSNSIFAQFDFESSAVTNAYQSVINLETTKANRQLASLKDSAANNPNGVIPLLENYLDIISLLTTEDKELYKKLKPNESIRIREIKKLDQNSPYYLYTQADIKLQWAFVELIFQDYVNGFLDLKKANNLIDQNIKKYPNFKLNNKVKGLIDLLTEAAPKEANIALFATGLKRNTTGNQKLISTSVFVPLFKEEINIYLSFVNAYIKNEPELGLWKIKKTYENNPKNLFAQFTYANILAQLDKNTELLTLLESNPLYKKPSYLYIPYLDYLLGESQMKLKRYEDSKLSYKKFLKYSSKATFKATTCLQLALLYSATNQRDSSLFFIKKIQEIDKNDFSTDQYAHFISEKNILLDPTLARCKLMYEGQHYFATYQLLKNTKDYKEDVFNAEKYYLLASSCTKLGQKESSKIFYQRSIDYSHKDDKQYHGAYAAIKLAYLLDAEGKIDEARVLFKKAGSYTSHFYIETVKKHVNLKLAEIGY